MFTTDDMDNIPDTLKKGVREALNKSGYGFQYAVARHIIELARNSNLPFRVSSTEFPVQVGSGPTHIDILLQHVRNDRFYLVCECKRADPSHSNWVFFRSPITGLEGKREGLIVREGLYAGETPTPYIQWFDRDRGQYNLCLELKSQGKGSGEPVREQFNTALSQVLRGMNGLILLHAERHPERSSSPFFPLPEDTSDYADSYRNVVFFPIIITTAQLWASELDLSTADLQTGNIEIEKLDVKRADWLLFQHAQSPGIRHQLDYEGVTSLPAVLYREYTRTVAVANPSGLKYVLKFLQDEQDWVDV